jgi:hypothetical protein
MAAQDSRACLAMEGRFGTNTNKHIHTTQTKAPAHAHTYIHTYVCLHTHTNICMHKWTPPIKCALKCTHIHTHRFTDAQTHSLRHTYTHPHLWLRHDCFFRCLPSDMPAPLILLVYHFICSPRLVWLLCLPAFSGFPVHVRLSACMPVTPVHVCRTLRCIGWALGALRGRLHGGISGCTDMCPALIVE